MNARRIKKILLAFLILIVGVIVLLIVSINLPFGQRFITKKVNGILSNSEIPLHITSIRSVLPQSVSVHGITLTGVNGDTILYAEEAQASIVPFALLRKKIIISEIYVGNASVNFSRYSEAKQINIAEAFSKGKVDTVAMPPVSKKSWDVSIGKGELSGIKFRMNDSVSGIYINQKIGKISFKIDKMSITDNTVLVQSLEIAGATGNILIEPSKTVSKSGNDSSWNISLEQLILNNINQTYDDIGEKIMVELLLGEASIKTNKTDFKNKVIDIDKISVNQTSAIVRIGKKPGSQDVKPKVNPGKFPWDIKGNDVGFKNVSMKLYGYSDTIAIADTQRFSITGFDLSLAGIKLDSVGSGLVVKQAKFDLGNGFSLKSMKGKLESGSVKTTLNLSAVTGNSELNIEGEADGNIFDLINKPFNKRKVSASFDNTSLSVMDLFYFKTDLRLNPLFVALSKAPVKTGGSILLQDSVIIFSEISVSQTPGFAIITEGKIDNCFILEKASGKMQFELSAINSVWLKEILKASGIKIDLPELAGISLKGILSNSLKSPQFNIELISDLGNIDLQGTYNYDLDSFSLKSTFGKVLLNKILGYPALGSLSGSGFIAGGGIRQKAIGGDAKVIIDSVRFNDYDYSKIRIDCRVSPVNYDFRLQVNDPSLECDLNALMNTNDSILTLKAAGSFMAKLKNLHLYKDSLTVEGKLTADFKNLRNHTESGVAITGLKLTMPLESILVDSINVSLKADTSRTTVTAVSDFFNVNIQIEKPLSEMKSVPAGFKEYAKSFIDPKNLNSTERISGLPEMEASMKIRTSKVIGIFLQDTTLHFTNIEIDLNNSISSGRVNCRIAARNIGYGNLGAGSLNANLTDSANVMNMRIVAQKCYLYSMPVDKLLLNNSLADRQGTTRLEVFGKDGKVLYSIELGSSADSSNFYLKVPSKQLTMNGVMWQLDTVDILTYNRTNKLFLPTFKMHTNESVLALMSESKDGILTYKGEMSNVKFASLLPDKIFPGNPAATISGFIDYGLNKNKGMEIKSDLNFKDVKWSDLNFSNLAVKGSFILNGPEEYILEMTALLDSSKIALKASKPVTGSRTINAEFSRLPINTFQPFVRKVVSDLRGSISGSLNILSVNNKESFNGELNINKANLKINTLSSSYRIPDGKVLFTGKKMVLNKFMILDSLNNELLVNGSLDISDSKSILTDLEVSSSKLQVMNRKEEEKESFYGDIFVDSQLSVKGPITSPELKGRIVLTRGTEIFFREKEDLNLTESEKVLIFTSHNPDNVQKKLSQLATKPIYNRTSVEAIVAIDPATIINISLAKRLFNIDLMILGGGELNYNMLVNNQINLSGKYEISEGTADLKMTGWPNKPFRITKGGYLRWDGKLEDPELRFEAVNRVRSSYKNPVDNKQRDVDFNVTLKLSGRLSTLDVLFTINTPDQYLMSIINTLSPEEQMRQAITILLFAKVDLPGISTSSDYMTEQVNQLVASQLNQLTKTTIKGVDISFGIDSYVQSSQTGGQETKTSLSYEVKRALLNNRAQIEFSGRLNDMNKQPGSSDLSLNNVSFEYRLDSSGTKFLKVYNEHTYEDVFEGEVIKTGIGLTYRKSYRSFGDIWKREKKTRKTHNQK
jgi:translocation and assembly module TamB